MNTNEKLLRDIDKRITDTWAVNPEPQTDVLGMSMANNLSDLSNSLKDLRNDMKHEAKVNFAWNLINTIIAIAACVFAAIAAFY